MPSNVDQFVRANDNAGDYADHIVNGLNTVALDEIDDLFLSTDARDVEFWEAFEVNPKLTLSDYEQAPPEKREDIDWALGLAGLSAAATTQFFLQEAEKTIVLPLAYREQVLAPFDLTQAELVAAGKRQFEGEVVEHFAALQAKYHEEVSFLSKMPPKQLFAQLSEYGAIPSMEKQVADTAGYVARMTNYRPGSPQFKAEVERLIRRDAGDMQRQLNRRAVQQIYSYREVDGDLDALMVWLLESSNPCVFCIANAGEIKTLGDWIESGLPGAAVCAGANRCHCQLHAVGRLAA